MARGVNINKRGMDRLQKELQRELDKRPIRVPVESDAGASPARAQPATVNHYHAPFVTVNGDHAQVAWGDGAIAQGHGDVSQVAAGYAELARVVGEILSRVDDFSLSADESKDVREYGESLLNEVIKPEPDKTVIRRGVTLMKGLLAAVATGANQAVTAETAEFARGAIESIGTAIGA